VNWSESTSSISESRIQEELLDPREREILETIERYADGISFNKLAEELKNVVSRNTLRKYLKELKDQGLIIIQGGERRGQKMIIRSSAELEALNNLKPRLERIRKKSLDVADLYLKILDLCPKTSICDRSLIKELLAITAGNFGSLLFASVAYALSARSAGIRRYALSQTLEMLMEFVEHMYKHSLTKEYFRSTFPSGVLETMENRIDIAEKNTLSILKRIVEELSSHSSHTNSQKSS